MHGFPFFFLHHNKFTLYFNFPILFWSPRILLLSLIDQSRTKAVKYFIICSMRAIAYALVFPLRLLRCYIWAEAYPTIHLFFIILQQFQKSLAGGYIWKVLLFHSYHIQVTIPKLLRFHLRGNLLLPFVLCVINGSYYFQQDLCTAVPKEWLEIWLHRSLSWTHPFASDIYTRREFLCNSLDSSLNLSKVLVFVEPSGKGKSFIGLQCFELKTILVWLEHIFQGTDFCYFSKSGWRNWAGLITDQKEFFFLKELRTKGNDSNV